MRAWEKIEELGGVWCRLGRSRERRSSVVVRKLVQEEEKIGGKY